MYWPSDTELHCLDNCVTVDCTTTDGFDGACIPAGSVGACNGMPDHMPVDCEIDACVTGTCYGYTDTLGNSKLGCFASCPDFQGTCAYGEYCGPLTSGGGVCIPIA